MAERNSALAQVYEPGRFGEPGEPGVTLREARGLVLYQVAAWPETLDTVGSHAAESAGAAAAGARGTLLRIEPLKWWLYGAKTAALDPEQGVVLDLSHSRTVIQVAGSDAATCLNRLVPIDLREPSFPTGSVASTVMHHVGVALWHSENGYELFLPRGFAVSLWQVLIDTAVQFGVEVL